MRYGRGTATTQHFEDVLNFRFRFARHKKSYVMKDN